MTVFACGFCGTLPVLTTGAEIYRNRPDLHDKPVWACRTCPDTYVGCHPGTENPLGTPAGPELRRARMLLHQNKLDPLWMTADRTGGYVDLTDAETQTVRKAARTRVYRWLAEQLGISGDDCHTAMFDLDRCRAAWRALSAIDYPAIREWATQHRGDAKPKRRKAA